MKKVNFLLEIGVENFPARFVRSAVYQLKNSFENLLKKYELNYKEIVADGSCERFFVFIKDVDRETKEKIEIVRGPRKEIAFLDSKPTKQLLGFLKKHNSKVEDIKFITEKNREIVAIQKENPPQKIESILEREIPFIIKNMHFEKNMFWPETDFAFPRPIRYLVALLGTKKLNVKLDRIISNKYSYKNFKKIKINSSNDYFEIMKKNGVILKMEDREKTFYSLITQKEKISGGKIINDHELLSELLELNENPDLLVGNFKEKYTQLPKEIIITVLKHHQKFFSFIDGKNRILPFFLTIIEKGKDKKLVVKNMERVVEARLEDATFFFKNDLKKDISYFIEKLKGIVFLENLGTLFDKTERIKKLCEFIIGKKQNIDKEKAIKIAELSRFDNSTELVYEFPELEGIAGRIYALEKGIQKDVAYGIENFRKNPKNLETLVVFISDTIDTLVGAFLLKKFPKGSLDPLGLKKLASILIEKIIDFDFDIDLDEIIKEDLKLYSKENVQELRDFIFSRIEIFFKEIGFRYDEINAILLRKEKLNPFIFKKKLDALKKLREKKDFYGLINGFIRANNILSQAEKKGIEISDEVNRNLLNQKEEIDLYNKFLTIKSKFSDNFNKFLFYEALKNLVEIKKEIDMFFDKVMVMVENEEIRKNRIALLKEIKNLFLKFGDLSKIVIEGGKK